MASRGFNANPNGFPTLVRAPVPEQRVKRRVSPVDTISDTSSYIDGDNSDSEHQDGTGDGNEPFEPGMTSETKDLYRESNREPWQEWSPDDIGINSKSTPESTKFALIVRREKQIGDTGEPVLVLHSVTIQSPIIKAQLGPVFTGYRGINTNLSKLVFNAPFREFFYRWAEFIRAKPKETDENKIDIEHYNLLFDIIGAEIKPQIEQTGDLLTNNVISFDYVWALFEPGTEIYSYINGHDRLFLLGGGSYIEIPGGGKLFKLSCRFIDTDGEVFGYKTMSLSIVEFENLKPVSELNVVPSNIKSGIDDIRCRLNERGCKFETLKGSHHKAYSGPYDTRRPPYGSPYTEYIEDGRIMIDCRSFTRYNGGPVEQLEPLSHPSNSAHLDMFSLIPGLEEEDDFINVGVPEPIQMMQHMARQMRRKFAATSSNMNSSTTLSAEHYALCTPFVKGFCLKEKEWGTFDVNLVKDIEWDKETFDRLVLPHDYKEIIWAFVEAKLSGLDNFDDVIRGKGRGIIMLLSGEPGTGKTLTSESVAEEMKKPLYGMGAGELGDTADAVEKSLQRVLELSARWGAVLLLDECDVFLEKRTASDLNRNKLVSVFLRLLEYYQGVMFLTTNRAASFDPAFESRIHLAINYPDLDATSRSQIWRTFIKPETEISTITAAEVEELSMIKLNGRQIKNVVKTARLLAARDRAPLSLEHVQIVLRVKRGEPAA